MKKNNKSGFVITAELLLISTILVIGLVVGLTLVRNAVVAELEDTAEAIGAIDQSYYYTATDDVLGGTAGSGGTTFTDAPDAIPGLGTSDGLPSYDLNIEDNGEASIIVPEA